MKTTWSTGAFVAKTQAELAGRLKAAGKMLEPKMRAKLEGEGSGHVYSKPGGGTYRASAPGEPPAERTGALMRSVTSKMIGSLTLRIGSPMPYAGYLEWGTETIKQRPWLRSTIFGNKQNILRALSG